MMGLEEIKERNTQATNNAVLRSALEHVYARAMYARCNPHVPACDVLKEICENCVEALEGSNYDG